MDETGFFAGGPEGDFATGLEGPRDEAKTAAVVEARVFLLHEGGRAVIDIQQDGVVTGILRTADDIEDVAHDDLDARIVQQRAVHRAQELAVPSDDLGQQFGDFHRGAGADKFEHPPEAVAQAEPADEHAGVRGFSEPFAGQLRQQQLRSGGGGAHQLPPVELEEIFPVVLVERELRAVRGAGLAEIAEGFQSGKSLRPAFFGGGDDVRDDFRARLRAQVALTVNAHAHVSGFQVAVADDEHGVDLRRFGLEHLALDVVAGGVDLGADACGAQFALDAARVFHEQFFVAQRQHAHLHGREPEREIPGVMLDEEADEALVRAERRAMDAQRRLVGVVAVLIDEAEAGGHGEIDLVGGDGELAPDGAPDLHVDLRAVESGFVGDFDEVDAALDEDVAHHVFGLLPKLRLIHELLAELGRIMRGEAHQIFIDAEDFEVFQIHLVDGVELALELLLGAVEMGVVHLHGADAHEAEQLARLLVTVAGAVFGEPQREIAVTTRHSTKNLVVMRAVHRFEVVSFHTCKFRSFICKFLSF